MRGGQFYELVPMAMGPHPTKPVPILVGCLSEGDLRRALWRWLAGRAPQLRRDQDDRPRHHAPAQGIYDRENEPFEISLQCPESTTVDDIKRLEDLGVASMWIVPWVHYGAGAESVKMAAEGETPGMFNVQPPLQVKVDAIKRYGDEIISKFK